MSTAIGSASFGCVERDDDEDEDDEYGLVIVDSKIAALRCARFELMEEARLASRHMSANEWLESVRETSAAKTIGPRELRAIVNLAWDF